MDGVPVAVREWGEPGARPLIFLHGLGPVNSSALLGLAAAPLVEAGFRLVGVDLPGFGASPTSAAQAYEVPRLADLVWDVADACYLQRPVILGHSWGATIACQAVAARPDEVAALVLADSGHRDWADFAPDLLATPLEEIVRGGEGVRLRAPDRAAVAGNFEVATDDPFVDVALAALVDDAAGGLISRATGEVLGAAQYHAVRNRPSRPGQRSRLPASRRCSCSPPSRTPSAPPTSRTVRALLPLSRGPRSCWSRVRRTR